MVSADILLFYFSEQTIKKALIVATAGTGIGWAAIPVLAQDIFDRYGFTVAVAIIGSLNIIQTLAALTYAETDRYPKPIGSDDESTRLVSSSSQNSLKGKLKSLSCNLKVRF